jgi:hypothetical protein
MTPDDEHPGRRYMLRVLAWVSIPAIWRQLGPREWARLGEWMMTALGDEDAARAEVYRAHAAWADQADAAADEAHRLNALPFPGEYDRAEIMPDQLGEAALRGQALRVLAGLSGGSLTGCPHASWDAPRPLFAASWGRRVDCRDCFRHAPVEEPTPLDARTCDICARVYLRPVVLATPTVGMMTIGLGICTRCIRRMAEAQPNEPT